MEIVRSLRLAPVILLSAALLLAACGSQTGPGGQTDPDSAGAPTDPATSSGAPVAELLEGRTFVSTGITGHQLVEGTEVRMVFDGSSLRVQAGCNTLLGVYAVEQGSLRVTDLAGTEMGCPEELMAQDQWLAQLVESGPGMTVAGDELTLVSGETALVLTDRVVADPDEPLEGTVWQLDSSIRGDAVSHTVGMEHATIRFDTEEGVLLVETGCNTGSAPYERAGDEVSVGPLALTRMACEPQAMAIEELLVEALDGRTLTVSVVAGQLTLTGEGGDGLGLRARP
jgi:heat shock protein HslJ